MLNIDNPVLPLVAYRVSLVMLVVNMFLRFLDPDAARPVTIVTVLIAPVSLAIGYWMLTTCYKGSRPMAWFFVITTPLSWILWATWMASNPFLYTTLGLTAGIISSVSWLTLGVTTLRKTRIAPPADDSSPTN
jgi:hypothetical protein